MARLAVGMVFGVVVGMLVGAAAGLHADDDDIVVAANELGLDEQDLRGAVNTSGYDPRTYLCLVKEAPCPRPAISGAVARADCVIAKESGGLDIPNRQGSGATGPGQYFPSTWSRHVSLYRAATGDAGSLSLHVLADVRRVMAFMLERYPASRAEWSVGGC